MRGAHAVEARGRFDAASTHCCACIYDRDADLCSARHQPLVTDSDNEDPLTDLATGDVLYVSVLKLNGLLVGGGPMFPSLLNVPLLLPTAELITLADACIGDAMEPNRAGKPSVMGESAVGS